jgi:lipopolysaccharide export LptBFGC system permease protein LptF
MQHRYQDLPWVLIIIIGYYIFGVWCNALAEKGSVAPFLGAWLT